MCGNIDRGGRWALVGRGALPLVRAVCSSSVPWLFRLSVIVSLFVGTETYGVTRYVWTNSPSPAAPYTNWITAARGIQTAIDAAGSGDLILVTNGIYETGGRAVHGSMTNRIAITNAITIKSINGAGVTVVKGKGVGAGGTNNGAGAIRCAYISPGASLSGFTLTGGYTLSVTGDWGNAYELYCGGGVYCDQFSSVTSVSNCVVTGNSCHGYGGGAFYGLFYSCLFEDNEAGDQGGGAFHSQLFNCTVVRNRSIRDGGGGVRWGSIQNSIVMGNDGNPSNYWATLCDYSCTQPLPPSGVGNISLDPLLVNFAARNYRLKSNSPCIDTGQLLPWMTNSVDLDGSPRVQPGAVDMGAYEYSFTPPVIRYVWTNSPTPNPPFTNWATAARDIQTAVNASGSGDMILVTNGTYNTGGVAVDGTMSNRVAITNAVTVMSVNGPAYTAIVGQGPSGSQAVRCVYLTSGAQLNGFCLTNGYTQTTGGFELNSGGGAYCSDRSAVLSNCWVLGNTAVAGGGVFRGSMFDSDIAKNLATLGGGANSSVLHRCTITSNIARQAGGGVAGCLVNESSIMGNFSYTNGGGAADSVISNCVITANQAGAEAGGAAVGCTLAGCLVSSNSAPNGGGAAYSTLRGSFVHGNSAQYGGGLYSCTAINSTVVDNRADAGGGAHASVLKNSIVYHNRARFGPNWPNADQSSRGVFTNCCTTPLPPGSNNFTNAPEILGLSNPHIVSNSPCRDAGSPALVSDAVDYDGEPRTNGPAPDVGCDEFQSSATTAALVAAISAPYVSAVAGAPLTLSAEIQGIASRFVWNLGDGTILTDRTVVAHAWAGAGTWPVTLTAFNGTNTSIAALTVNISSGWTNFVAVGGAHVPPFTTWSSAATNIQAALDANTQYVGAVTLVSNGTYSSGYTGSNSFSRIALTRPIRLLSVGGPGLTRITGSGVGPGATNNGAGAIRCVYLAAGSSLSGFTVTNGHTEITGDLFDDQSGGGIWCEDQSPEISNCIVAGCSANNVGGGVLGGTLRNSQVLGNTANYGAGVRESEVHNSQILGNTAMIGGGASWSVLFNSLLKGNRAGNSGAGTDRCILYNSTVVSNSATSYGGGVAWESVSINSIVVSNIAGTNANYYASSAFYNSCSIPTPTIGSNNIGLSPLFVDAAVGNLRLQPGSPCRNAGTNQPWMFGSTDLEGRPRILEGTVDMGAYEFSQQGSLLVVSTNAIEFLLPEGQSISSKVFTVRNGGTGSMFYAVSPEMPWLSASPAGGVSTGETDAVIVTASALDLFPGEYSGTVSVSSAEATNSPQSIAVVLTIIPSFGVHVGAPELPWVTGGDMPWFVQVDTTYDGISAAQSGSITNSEQSWIETSVEGPGTLSFWWKVSSEATFDLLAVYLDSTQQLGRISGEVDWQQRLLPVGPGDHVVRWRYSKDTVISVGKDAGWLDMVNWSNADDNTNGIPDWWEYHHFGSLTNVTTVSDWDGDRTRDGDEYWAGTDPTNSASFLGILNADATSTGHIITWQSATNRRYSLDRATNLLGGFDEAILTNILATPPINAATDTSVIGLGPWLYRINLEP